MADGKCQANNCTCGNGGAAADERCRRDGEESCAQCDFGYHLAGRLCAANRCSCRGGTAAGPEACAEDGGERCGKCDEGFHLRGGLCAPNRCSCGLGDPASGPACDLDGAERCSRCNGGLHLVEHFCQKNRCHCHNGKALTGAGCERDGAERCRSCDPGFHMVRGNFTCARNYCTCHHGTAVMGAGCLLDGAESCDSCDAGYHLADGLCVENACECRGGVAPRGVDCATDGAWLCTSCLDGFHLSGEHCDPYIHVFSGETGGAPGLFSDLKVLGHVAQSFTGSAQADWTTHRAGVLLVPELSDPLELDLAAMEGLKGWIGRGGHLVICGDYFGHNGRFLNSMFGWSLQGVLSYGSPKRGEDCSIFCKGPQKLEWNPEVSCYAGGHLPVGTQAVYRDASSVCVFTMELGSGRVTYLGFDWYNSTRRNWMQVLHLAVIRSGAAAEGRSERIRD